ncbi:DUF6446 family protein [Rhodobacteraceae bacterium KMM 6894]|nr:DUF6446 family protein [Rhodobacteraceae bacterium KMM 6894]
MGKFLTVLIAVCAIGGGILLYYQQVYAYYSEVVPNGTDDVQIVSQITGMPQAISYDGFQAIDADSSPIRYRACFTTSLDHAALTETYVPADNPVPLLGPKWFDCFDAKEVGKALEDGAALAFLSVENIQYGIDRIVAIHADGRGWVWNQINRCGEVVFDGNPAPADCPPSPQGY